jgi:hypothetical protein
MVVLAGCGGIAEPTQPEDEIPSTLTRGEENRIETRVAVKLESPRRRWRQERPN